MITLTTHEGYQGLGPAIDHLFSSFRKLQKTPIWKKYVKGGVAFLELKYNDKIEKWHPHLHALVHGSYFPHPQLKLAWLKVTGGSHIVDIRPAGGSDAIARYVTKYATKPMDIGYLRVPPLLDEAVIALRSRRMCTTFGNWRSVLLTDRDDEAGWSYLADLNQLIFFALHGDQPSRDILDQIDAHATEASLANVSPRAPPTYDTTLSPAAQQLRLFDTHPILH